MGAVAFTTMHLVLLFTALAIASADPATDETLEETTNNHAMDLADDMEHANATDSGRTPKPWENATDPYKKVPVFDLERKLGWEDGDPITVFYAEYLMASWLLQRAPWNCYHSGLAFVNNRTGKKAIMDFVPDDTSSVMNMVLPLPTMADQVRALVFGEVEFKYRDGAQVLAHTGWGGKYEKFERLGVTNGSVFNAYVRKMVSDFAPRYRAFRPVEVASQTLNTTEHGVALRSFMCHDFVTDSLWVLYNLGARYEQTGEMFRDHVIMYVDGYTKLDDSDRRMARKQLRWLRSLEPYMADVRQEFTNSRVALIGIWKLGVSAFFRNPDGDYVLRLVPPFINYCYLPVALPPVHHDPFISHKLCALGMEANLTNTSAKWPMGHLLAVEDRMDHPQVFISFGLILLSSVVMGAAPAAAQKHLHAD